MKRVLIFIFLLFSFCAGAQSDSDIPARPSPPRLVNDFTGTLTPQQVQALEQKLIAYDDSTSSQVVIVMIESLGRYDIADYGLRLGRKWGIGQKDIDNGVLIIVAKNDHKMRIEVGYGLEGAIPDITAKSIMDNSMAPQFREGNYYRGLELATDDIITAARGEYKAPPGYGKKSESRGLGIGAIIFLIFLFMLIGGVGGGRGGPRSGGMMSAAGWIIGSMLGGSSHRGSGWSGGGGGGGWSGGGGGGFGGFGGGGFGGGGASGSW